MWEMNMREFGDRIQKKRQQKKLTQKELATAVGVSQNSMSAYIRGEKTPAVDIAMRIAQTLGVSISWLCGEQPGNTSGMQTYTDLFMTLDELFEAPVPPTFFMFDFESNETYVDCGQELLFRLSSSDETVKTFLTEYKKLLRLVRDGIISKEIFNAWLEKQYREYASKPLSESSTKSNYNTLKAAVNRPDELIEYPFDDLQSPDDAQGF